MPHRKSAIIGSSVGTIIEWYDFTLYGLATALIFGPLFFGGSGLAGILGSFATFAVGFGVRPIGGFVFAHFGDRLGRRTVFLTTLLLMGIPTALIGLLPTQGQIGVWAPILLIVLRMAQGAGAGAEFAGATTVASESSSTRGRAVAAGFPSAAVYGGMAIATAIFTAVRASMPEQAFVSWGWRVPFLLGAVIVVVALYFRLRIHETPAFAAAAAEDALRDESAPVVGVMRSHWRVILGGIAIFVFELPWLYIVQTFSVSYVTGTLGVDATTTLIGVLIAELVTIGAVFGFGALADRIGRKPIMVGAAIFGVLFAFPMFALFLSGHSLLVAIALCIGIGIVQGATVGIAAAWLSELLPTRGRWTGVVAARELPAAIVGGTAPFVATWLVASGGGTPWLVAGYLVVLSIIGLIGALTLTETVHRQARRDLTAPVSDR